MSSVVIADLCPRWPLGGTAWDGIKAILSGVWDAIKGIVGLALDAVKLLMSLAWDGTKPPSHWRGTGS